MQRVVISAENTHTHAMKNLLITLTFISKKTEASKSLIIVVMIVILRMMITSQKVIIVTEVKIKSPQ